MGLKFTAPFEGTQEGIKICSSNKTEILNQSFFYPIQQLYRSDYLSL
jgi:hypothetical protein